MTSEKFSEIEQAWYDKQHSVLGIKAGDYATEDRLYNFKAIAQLTGLTPLQCAMVLRAKHVVALYEKVFKGEPISEEFFNEKAGDDANYIVLAKALHVDEKEEPKTSKMVMPMEYNAEKDTYSYWSERYQQWFHDIDGLINGYYELKDKELERNPIYMTEMEGFAKYHPMQDIKVKQSAELPYYCDDVPLPTGEKDTAGKLGWIDKDVSDFYPKGTEEERELRHHKISRERRDARPFKCGGIQDYIKTEGEK